MQQKSEYEYRYFSGYSKTNAVGRTKKIAEAKKGQKLPFWCHQKTRECKSKQKGCHAVMPFRSQQL